MDLSRLSIWAKIRTFSAGVWHNLILSFICYLIIQSRDVIFDPFYSQLSGFVVQEVSPDSSISGDYGIEVGDIIYQINDCNFTQSSDISSITTLNPPFSKMGKATVRRENYSMIQYEGTV